MAAVSESLDSLLLLLFEFELLLEFALLLELLLEFEFEFPPPTKFCIKSCNLPHSTGLAGKRQATRQTKQAKAVATFIKPIGDDLMCLLVVIEVCCCLVAVADRFVIGIFNQLELLVLLYAKTV